MEIQDLISENEPLASLPKTFYFLQVAMEDPNSDFTQIEKNNQHRSRANPSPFQNCEQCFYSYGNQTETVSHALGVVGTKQLIQLVLATSVIGQFKGIPKHMTNMEYFQRHSVTCKLVARTISEMKNETDGERYFVAGLLHVIGRLLMYLKIPDQFGIAMDFTRKS